MTAERLAQILPLLPVDTAYERSLLEHIRTSAGEELILVAGDQRAAPHTLLPVSEQLFTEVQLPGFPIYVEYGDRFSVCVETHAGEKERYQSAADFRQFCGPRLDGILRCSVYVPAQALEGRRLVYFLLNENTNCLNIDARGAACCVVVVSGEAGGFSDDYAALFHWLRSERCISGRTALILHQHRPVGNQMLPKMANSLLGQPLPLLRCGAGRHGVLSREEVVLSAAKSLQEGSSGADTDRVTALCRSSLEEKLRDGLSAAKKEHSEAAARCDKLNRAEQAFLAMCLTEQYSLSSLVTEEEMESIRREIRGMFAALRRDFPTMVTEVVKCAAEPKKDLKNLAGDYLTSVIDGFIRALMEDVSQNLLIPRLQKSFQSVCGRFRRMMQDLELPYEDIEYQVELELLKISNVNIGDYHTWIAEFASFVLSSAVTMLLSKLTLGWSNLISSELKKLLSLVLEPAADHFVPAEQYGRSLAQDLHKHLENEEKQICDQLDKTIFPQLYAILQKEFSDLTEAYDTRLKDCIAVHQAVAQAADKRAAGMEMGMKRLDEIFGSAEGSGKAE